MGATHAPRKFLKRQSLMFRYVTHIINGHIVTLLLTFTHTNAGLQHARLYLRKSHIPSPTSAIGRRACEGFEQRFKFLNLESLAQCL